MLILIIFCRNSTQLSAFQLKIILTLWQHCYTVTLQSLCSEYNAAMQRNTSMNRPLECTVPLEVVWIDSCPEKSSPLTHLVPLQKRWRHLLPLLCLPLGYQRYMETVRNILYMLLFKSSGALTFSKGSLFISGEIFSVKIARNTLFGGLWCKKLNKVDINNGFWSV